MKILVYEYFSGGGAEKVSPSADLFALGRAMLRACVEDCIAAGHEVFSIADPRFVSTFPAQCAIKTASSGQWLSAFNDSLNSVDAVLPIAPETDGILKNLSALVERSGKLLLGSSSETISLAGDKLASTDALARHGCNTPKTALWPVRRGEFRAKKPWILKPRRGAGCAGIYLTSSPESIKLPQEDFIVQEFVTGTAASVAIIIGESNHIVVSVNSQDITFDPVPRYNGGTIPLVHPLSQEAINCARRVCEALPGLRGYVGVDMVLTDNAVYVIEVNPRITFTYCGLRRIVPENLMSVILKAAVGIELSEIPLTGSIVFDGSGRIVKEIHSELVIAQVR